MKRFLGAVAVIVVLLIAKAIGGAIGGAAGDSIAGSSSGPPELTAEVMEEMAAEVKKRNGIPLMVDEETEWYDVTGSYRRFNYHYRLVNYLSSDFEPGDFIAELAPTIIADVCAEPEMKPLMDFGGSYSYNYVGSDDSPIGSFLVSATDCGY